MEKYDTEAIRQLLNIAISDEELDRLCFDHFRSVHDQYSVGMTRTTKIQLLLEYCERQSEFEELLNQLEKLNPSRFRQYDNQLHLKSADLKAEVKTERTQSEGITIHGNVGPGVVIGSGQVNADVIAAGNVTIYNISTSRQPVKVTEDELQLLCLIYIKANGSYFFRAIPQDIGRELNLTEEMKIVRKMQSLNRKRLVDFETLAGGVKLTHSGVLVAESQLSKGKITSGHFSSDEINSTLERIRSRYRFLRSLYEKSHGDPYESVLTAAVTAGLGIDNIHIHNTIIPYLRDEGWLKDDTNDSIRITEKGIEKFESQSFEV